jgi:hypothetical protein
MERGFDSLDGLCYTSSMKPEVGSYWYGYEAYWKVTSYREDGHPNTKVVKADDDSGFNDGEESWDKLECWENGAYEPVDPLEFRSLCPKCPKCEQNELTGTDYLCEKCRYG